ncbi:MAG TPA: hypothetical protein VFI96_01390, partial [Longimicrobiaceae bacterium]|nr:hypothetical protein [Longimicrobiaceae bacterium]
APDGWYRDSLLAHLSATRSTEEATYEVRWLPSGRVQVRRTAPTDSLVGTFAPRASVTFGGITVAFLPMRPGIPEQVELATLPFGEAVRNTAGRLKAERKRRDANLVRIDYDDPDPGLALAVVSSAMERFTALRSELQRRESGGTTDSLRALAEQTLAELRRQEEGLARFQRESRLIAPEAQSGAVVKRQAEVMTALEKARAELAGTDDVLRRLADTPDPGRAWASLVAHPTFLENQTLGELLGQLVELQQTRLALSGRRTPEDREMQSLARQISYLDGSLRSLVHQYRDGVAQQVRLLEQEKEQLDSALALVPSATVELGRRERAVRQLSEIYLFTDQRLRQEALRGAVSFSTIQVVDPPEVLFRPVWPRKKLGLAVGLLLALTFGAMGMALAERADRTRRPENAVPAGAEPEAEETEVQAEDGAWR